MLDVCLDSPPKLEEKSFFKLALQPSLNFWEGRLTCPYGLEKSKSFVLKELFEVLVSDFGEEYLLTRFCFPVFLAENSLGEAVVAEFRREKLENPSDEERELLGSHIAEITITPSQSLQKLQDVLNLADNLEIAGFLPNLPNNCLSIPSRDNH